jgi:hypothetical protein
VPTESLSAFAASMADSTFHPVRSPGGAVVTTLNTIAAYIETVMHGDGPPVTGAVTAVEAEAQRFAQMVDQAVDLIREAWAARPELAEAVIAGRAFPALVRALDRYADAGLDARDLLAAIPLGKLAAPTIKDQDRFAVDLTHRVAQRQLDALNQARRAAQYAANQAARHRSVAAILRHAWRDHPEPAERVIAGPVAAAVQDSLAGEAGLLRRRTRRARRRR